MLRLLALWTLLCLCVLSTGQTFIVTNSGPASGLSNDELVYDITIQTNNPQGVQNIEFGAMIRTTPTPNGWNTVTSTSNWGVGGWQGNGDVVYTTYFLGKGTVVNVQVRVHCDPGFKGDLSVEAYARLSGGYTLKKQVITKVGPMKVRILDAVTGQPLAGPELQPSVLRVNSITPLEVVRRRCKLLVEAPTLAGRFFRAYVLPSETSGGHDHPTPTDRLHGWFRNWTTGDPGFPVTGPSAKPGTLEFSGYDMNKMPYRAQFDAFGKAEFQYIAPEISGSESIVVETEELLEPDRYKIPTDIRLRFPNLVPVVANENLELYSSNVTQEKHAPGTYTGRYYVTETMRQAIEAFAINFKADLGTKLKVNDASLVDGGLFDISGEWLHPHIAHRNGREFDLGGVSTPNATVERIAREQGWWTIPGPKKAPSYFAEGSHYHFVQLGQGTPYMALLRYRTSWHDQANRVLKVEMDFLNKGGVDAVTNMITTATADNGVTVQSGTNTDFGSANIRVQRTATLLLNVPGGVSQFILNVRGESTLQSQPNHPFVGDLELGGLHGVGYYLLTVSTGPPKLRSFVLTKFSDMPGNSVGAGQPIGGRVYLNGPAITPTVVNLTSSNPGVAQVPANVVIPVGQSNRSFTVTTAKVSPQTVTLTASSGSVTLPITLNLLASIQSLSFSPPTVQKGQVATLNVVFTGVASAGTNLHFNVPTDKFVSAAVRSFPVGGQSQFQLPLTTKAVGAGTVTATLNRNKVQASVTITP